MSTNERGQVQVDRAEVGDLNVALVGMQGIMTALSWIVVHKVADDPAIDRPQDAQHVIHRQRSQPLARPKAGVLRFVHRREAHPQFRYFSIN